MMLGLCVTPSVYLVCVSKKKSCEVRTPRCPSILLTVEKKIRIRTGMKLVLQVAWSIMGHLNIETYRNKILMSQDNPQSSLRVLELLSTEESSVTN